MELRSPLLLLLVVFAPFFLGGAVPQTPSKDADAHYNLGNALYDRGELEGAAAEYREALRLKPDFPFAHTNLGLALYEKGDVDGAITEYREAIRLMPNLAEAHNDLANALKDRGDLDGAVAEYRDAIRLMPDFAGAHNNLGIALGKKGDLGGAIVEFRKAIQLKPDFAVAHYFLGNTLQEKGDRDAAIAAYQRSVALNPKFPEALANLGSALASKGEIGEAIDAYREALKLMPDSGEIHRGLGVALRRSGDEAAANREFQEAQQLDPKLDLPPPRGTLPIAENFTSRCGSGTKPGRALLGLGCLTDDNHGYVALLKTNGTGGIVRFNRAFTALAGENKLGSIQGLGRTNRLRLVCDGRGERPTVISFYVNGRKVASAEDEQGYRWFNSFLLYADTFPGVVTFGHFFASQPAQ